jgi:hypothetical protein
MYNISFDKSGILGNIATLARGCVGGRVAMNIRVAAIMHKILFVFSFIAFPPRFFFYVGRAAVAPGSFLASYQ